MDVSLTQSLDEQQKSALSSFVKEELSKIIDECDDVIVDYVMVMIYNGKTMQAISSDLEEFVEEPHRSNFALSLAKRIQDLEKGDTQPSSTPKMISLTKKSDRPMNELRTSREGGAAPSRLLQSALQSTNTQHHQSNKRPTNSSQHHQNHNNKRTRQEPQMMPQPMGPPMQPPFPLDMPPMPPMMAPMEMMDMIMYQQNMMAMMMQMQQQPGRGRGRGRGGYRGRGRFSGRYNASYHAPEAAAEEEEAPLGPIVPSVAPTPAFRGRGGGRFHGRTAPSRGRGRSAASVNRTWVKPPTLEDSLTTDR